MLAELHSPSIPSFLHGVCGDIPFLVSEEAKAALKRSSLAGFEFGPVIVAKLATRGKRNRKAGSRELEDAILKPKGVDLSQAPRLFSIIVTARMSVTPDHKSGRHPDGWVPPFEWSVPSGTPDLFRPQSRGRTYSAWTFCSERFKGACDVEQLLNIAFEPFQRFMLDFRERLQSYEASHLTKW